MSCHHLACTHTERRSVCLQIYEQVQALLPDVVYNGPARMLTLRASGVRKQPRLPGQHDSSFDHSPQHSRAGIACSTGREV